jgi:hypothetical protein
MSMIYDRLSVVDGTISPAREEEFTGWENQDRSPWSLDRAPIRKPRRMPWVSVEDSAPGTGTAGVRGGLRVGWRSRRG